MALDDGFLRLCGFNLGHIADARRVGDAQFALPGFRAARRRRPRFYLRAELHDDVLDHVVGWIREWIGRSGNQSVNRHDVSGREDAQTQCASFMVARRPDHRWVARISHETDESGLANAIGYNFDSDHRLWRVDFWAAIPAYRAKGV